MTSPSPSTDIAKLKAMLKGYQKDDERYWDLQAHIYFLGMSKALDKGDEIRAEKGLPPNMSRGAS